MQPTRNSWTDERLDNLNQRVEDGFNRIDADIRGLRSEMSATRTEPRDEMAGLRSEMNDRFNGLQRVLVQFGGAMIAVLIGVIATLLATQI